MKTRRIAAGYEEDVELPDGSRVRLRWVRPGDKELLRRGVERLSPESRYRRFLAAKHELSEAELRYLTEFDGEAHVALGATRDTDQGEEGLAVARFVRLDGEPDCAEAAIAVADDWQGKGLGKILLQRLMIAARERGVGRFRAYVLAENEPAMALLRRTAESVTAESDGDVVAAEIGLPAQPGLPEPSEPHRSALHDLLRLVARRALAVRALLADGSATRTSSRESGEA